MQNESPDGMTPDNMGFLIQLMSAGHAQTTGVMNSLISSLNADARRNEAQLALIRRNVEALLCGPYVPHPNTIVGALYPGSRETEEWLEDHYPDGWRNPESPRLRFGCDCCD